MVTLRAENPYHACLVCNGEMFYIAGASNLIISGFEFKQEGPGSKPLIMQIAEDSHHIVVENNVFHDTYNNDLLKIGHAPYKIVIRNNIFYNNAYHQHQVDINGGARDIEFTDNILFNDFKGSGRDVIINNPWIVIKTSLHEIAPGTTNHINIRRCIFLNYQSADAAGSFISLGKDGGTHEEFSDICIENCLFLFNSEYKFSGAIQLNRGKNITIRNNTFYGKEPHRHFFLTSHGKSTGNPCGVKIYNNIFASPAGSIGKFSGTDDNNYEGEILDCNLFWNMSSSSNEDFSMWKDKNRIIADPMLPPLEDVILPRWDREKGSFLSGNTTIREEFIRLARMYGAPKKGSKAIGAAKAENAPVDDILGRVRNAWKSRPDIGAFETDGVEVKN